MRRKYIRGSVILLLILSFALCGCGKTESPESVYQDYMELALEDTHEAQRKYVYFRNQELEELAFVGSWKLYNYEIHEWEQLSDRLWVVYVTMHTSYEPESGEGINFVGIIDDKYWVIPGILGLPDELKEGVDFSRFQEYLGEIAPEDILK